MSKIETRTGFGSTVYVVWVRVYGEPVIDISFRIKRSIIETIRFRRLAHVLRTPPARACVFTKVTPFILNIHTRLLFDEASIGKSTELTNATRQRKIARHEWIHIIDGILITKHVLAHS